MREMSGITVEVRHTSRDIREKATLHNRERRLRLNKSIYSPFTVSFDLHQVGIAKTRQMAGNQRLGEPQRLLEFGNTKRSLPQQI